MGKKVGTKKTCLRNSNTLMKELDIEDPKSFTNFLRINENMFNILLKKVCIYVFIIKLIVWKTKMSQ